MEFAILTAGYLGFGADVSIKADVSAYYIDTPLSGSAINRWRGGRLEKITAGPSRRAPQSSPIRAVGERVGA